MSLLSFSSILNVSIVAVFMVFVHTKYDPYLIFAHKIFLARNICDLRYPVSCCIASKVIINTLPCARVMVVVCLSVYVSVSLSVTTLSAICLI